MKRHEFQVNLHFGKGSTQISAFGRLGLIYAPNLTSLVKKIKKTFNIKAEQIKLTFQPE